MTAATMTWHPGTNSCGICSYPAVYEVTDGSGTVSHVCDEHVRSGMKGDIGDGSHTYLTHPNAYTQVLDKA
jgi:plastocyanin